MLIVLKCLLIKIFLRNLSWLIRLIVLLVIRWVIRSSYYSSNLGLLSIYLLSQVNRFISRSISSNLNFSSLLINCKLRHKISITLWLILCRIILRILLWQLLLDWSRIRLLVILVWYLTIVLISYNSIGNSWIFRSNFRYIINIDFLVGFFNKLSACIRSLVNYSWVFHLLLRYIYLLDSLNITWIVIIITNIWLWIYLLSKSKEVTLWLNFFLLNLLNRLYFLDWLLI